MLELNKEYTYKEICKILGWKETTGAQKTKQIKEIEASYEFFHPENKKTHKLKKSYIFTKQIKAPELTDGRKKNGAENLFPEDEFEYLLKCMYVKGFNINCYYCRGMVYEMYLSSSLIYAEFGFDVYSALKDVRYDESYDSIGYLFEQICVDAVKANTITRICKRYNYSKNSLPKGILREDGKNTVPDNGLLPLYEEYMKDCLSEHNCRSEMEAVKKRVYSDIVNEIKAKFEEEKNIHGVKRYNLIEIPVGEIRDFKVDNNKRVRLRIKCCRIIVDSIMKSVSNRCNDAKAYRRPLNQQEKKVLLSCLSQLLRHFNLDNEYDVDSLMKKDNLSEDDTDWLNQLFET